MYLCIYVYIILPVAWTYPWVQSFCWETAIKSQLWGSGARKWISPQKPSNNFKKRRGKTMVFPRNYMVMVVFSTFVLPYVFMLPQKNVFNCSIGSHPDRSDLQEQHREKTHEKSIENVERHVPQEHNEWAGSSFPMRSCRWQLEWYPWRTRTGRSKIKVKPIVLPVYYTYEKNCIILLRIEYI